MTSAYSRINSYMGRALVPQDSVKKPFFVGLGSLVVTLFFLAFFWPSLPPEIPLFYSKPWGEPQLVPAYFIAIPPFLSGVFLIANSAFAQTLDNYPLIRKLLVFSASTVCVLSAITVLRIILSVG